MVSQPARERRASILSRVLSGSLNETSFDQTYRTDPFKYMTEEEAKRSIRDITQEVRTFIQHTGSDLTQSSTGSQGSDESTLDKMRRIRDITHQKFKEFETSLGPYQAVLETRLSETPSETDTRMLRLRSTQKRSHFRIGDVVDMFFVQAMRPTSRAPQCAALLGGEWRLGAVVGMDWSVWPRASSITVQFRDSSQARTNLRLVAHNGMTKADEWILVQGGVDTSRESKQTVCVFRAVDCEGVHIPGPE